MSERTRGLGRGLSALLGDSEESAPRTRTKDAPADGEAAGGADKAAPAGGARGPQTIPIELIRPNPDQPRRVFAEAELEELAGSIRARGVIQPIMVRPADGETYEIVAGERRWRASQRAGLHAIPAVVRVLNEEETLEIALIENVQRADLTPLEEAEAYRVLADDFGRTQAQIAELIGKSRPHVANTMRLLELPQAVRDLLAQGALTAGHARALLGAPRAEALAQEIVRRGLSVRQAEALAKEAAGGASKAPGAGGGAKAKDPDTAALEADLEASLGLSVSLHDGGGGKGELRLRYETLEQLDDLCRRLTGG